MILDILKVISEKPQVNQVVPYSYLYYQGYCCIHYGCINYYYYY